MKKKQKQSIKENNKHQINIVDEWTLHLKGSMNLKIGQ